MAVYSSKDQFRPQTLSHLFSLRNVFITLCFMVSIAFVVAVYFSYQDHINPKHVYGQWIEVGTANYNQDTLELNASGVFRNQRLIATQFEFDGSKVFISTGAGISIYKITGTYQSPQLRRLQPNSPTQRFIKKGFEQTINMEDGGLAKRRRAALAEHFNEK